MRLVPSTAESLLHHCQRQRGRFLIGKEQSIIQRLTERILLVELFFAGPAVARHRRCRTCRWAPRNLRKHLFPLILVEWACLLGGLGGPPLGWHILCRYFARVLYSP